MIILTNSNMKIESQLSTFCTVQQRSFDGVNNDILENWIIKYFLLLHSLIFAVHQSNCSVKVIIAKCIGLVCALLGHIPMI